MNVCSNCGAELTEGTVFCPNCGVDQTQNVQVPEIQAADNELAQTFEEAPTTLTGAAKVMSIISMICGIVSLATCYGGLVPGIAAIILASLASKKAPGIPNSMAKTGKITGIIGTVLASLWLVGYIIYIVVVLAFATTGTPVDYYGFEPYY